MPTFAGRMKQKCCRVWFLTALCAVFLAVVANWQEQDVVSEKDHAQRSESSVITPQRQQPYEATLTDATQLYRICSSRPQRILPSQGTRNHRIITPAFTLWKQHVVKRLHSYFDSRCRMETAPFCLSASCDYYVIALRHIIR